MRKSMVVGLTLALATLSPTTQAAQITLDFDAFIPTERVSNPAAETLPPFFTEFVGDDRGFSLEATRSGQSRLFSQVVLDTEAPDSLVSSFTGGGTTIGFLQQDGTEVSQTAEASSFSHIEAVRTSNSTISLKVEARAANPLIEAFVPPEIEVPPAEYIYDIELTLLNDAIGYELVGTNRAYPNYSAFLNGEPILQNAFDANDAALLSVIEPVSSSGIVAVNEPVGLLGLGAASLVMLVGFCRRARNRAVECSLFKQPTTAVPDLEAKAL